MGSQIHRSAISVFMNHGSRGVYVFKVDIVSINGKHRIETF